MLRFVPLAALALAAPTQAYWEYGHETIALVAMANVKPSTARAVRSLLANQALLGTPECPARTPEEASYWADCIKPLKDAAGQQRYGYAFSWHYQNVDVCKPFDLQSACAKGDCVSAQVTRQAARLRDRRTSRKDKVEALAFLIHFVGDLHQPLHAGDKSDRGGNGLAAAYGVYAPPRFNIHSVWDGPLAERAITSGPSLIRRYPAAERARMGAGTVEDWSRDSWALSRDTAYAGALGGDSCSPSPAKVTLSDAAVAAAVPAARESVRRGGIRLARLLDEALF
ncbi:MAG: hypothetical protein JWN21_30 [Sphingomonas bacterium]|uniref:S1/P1 nuclease n=1 Tax=Sphingomonas bacterium TaxID=1895847 RepID=UPI002615A8B6|nr:S1/P1 nuclease [Sphingomonas bacterium]MDB5694487.1 hypothetical protein [Sphingomonas bacterium]